MAGQEMTLFVCRQPVESSERLLLRCAGYYSAASGRLLDGVRVERSAQGKPFFSPECGVYFSVSHAKGIWACVFANAPVGLDVECQRKCNETMIARRFFHPEEARLIERQPSLFFGIWTAKESYVKFTGTGITDAFSAFSVVQNGALAKNVGEAVLSKVEGIKGYFACICAQQAAALRICEIGEI